jgi:hypothetical protein
MDYNNFKTFLLNQQFMISMDSVDKDFFTNKINSSKPINNMNYYIDKYKLKDENMVLINKYNFHTNNYVPNMIIL